MVKQVIEVVYKEVKGLHQAAYVLALFAFGSQLLALVRDRLLASEFGAGPTLDIYYAAFRIPDLLFVLFASTLSVYVLIPFVTGYTKKNKTNDAKELLDSVFSVFLLLYTAVAVLLWVAMPFLTPLLFPGIEAQAELVSLSRILLLQPLLLGISSLFGVVTQLGHRFVLYALSPLLYNVGIIFGVVVLYPLLGLEGLALGVVFGAAMHLLVQVPLVRKDHLAFSFVFRIKWQEIYKVCFVSLPRALTLSLHQIVLLVLIGFASVMTAGSVAVFQFAFNLQSVPLAVVGVSYSVAAFPMLASLYSERRLQDFTARVMTTLRHILFWSIPIIALIIVLRAHVVRVVLGSGEFDWSDTRLTAAVLAILAVSLVAQAVNLLLVRAFYAAGNTRTPLYATLFGGGLAMLCSYYFYLFYTSNMSFQTTVATFVRLNDVVGSEILAIALGYSVAMIAQAILLTYSFSHLFRLDLRNLMRHSLVCFTAGVFGALLAYMVLQFLVTGINPNTFVGILLQGSIAGAVGVAGVVFIYYVIYTPELVEIAGSLERKLFKTDVIAPIEDV